MIHNIRVHIQYHAMISANFSVLGPVLRRQLSVERLGTRKSLQVRKHGGGGGEGWGGVGGWQCGTYQVTDRTVQITALLAQLRFPPLLKGGDEALTIKT